MFQATLVAFAGDPYEAAKYERDHNPPSGVAYPRPSSIEVEHYLAYLQSEFARGKKFGRFIYRQFGKQVPSALVGEHESWRLYNSFVRNLADGYHDNVQKIRDESMIDGTVDRFLMMYKYAELMKAKATGGILDEFLFISNQILLTMSELYEGDPLGEPKPENLFCGGGSVGGSGSLEQKGDKRSAEDKKRYAYGRYKNPEDAEKYLSIKKNFLADIITKETLDEIMETVKVKVKNDYLEIMLWRRGEDGVVRNLINGREFGIQDVEHMLVSIYLWTIAASYASFCKATANNVTYHSVQIISSSEAKDTWLDSSTTEFIYT
jgi:hypothetical protein